MANLYNVIQGLTPNQQEILEAELLAKQILEAEFPDLDLREGTGLRDLVLRPVSYAFALLRKGTDNYFAQNTLAGVDDTTDSTIVDDLLSNWFLTRNTGTYAVISARLYFARRKNVTLQSNISFSTDNTLNFYPIETKTYQATAMAYDSYQNEWYIDVDLRAAATGSQYNIGQGSLLYFTNFDPYFLHGEINYLSQSSTDGETNTQFLKRAETAISTRNLINQPSTISNLQDAFNNLKRITPVGMGDSDMIRDLIKVVIDPESPRTLSSLSESGGVAVATLPEHGFEEGQVIVITGAIPVGFNGTYSITSKTTNTFTFNVTSGLGTATIEPTVQSYTAPTLVHTGGMADIYCDSEIASSTVQLTTDSAGVAVLSGPVFSFSRSSVSGGSEDDTIPYTTPVNIASSSLDIPSKTLSITSTAHGLSDGTLINLSGVSQTKTITTINCSNLIVTVVVTGHGLSTGDQVTISGVTPVTYNGTYKVTVIDANTFTYALTANILTSGSGSSMIISNPSVVGNFQIAYTGVNTFNIVIPKLWSGATTDTTALAISYSVPYIVRNPNLQTKTVTALNGVGTIATATLPKHGYVANRYVTISGATPSYYNGTWLIKQVLSDSQFTFDIGTAILASATGTISSSYVVPWEDTGFSSRQELLIDFGLAYANRTASFDIEYFSNVDYVQTYLDSVDNHVLCGDLLARGFNLHMLDLGVTVYNGAAPSSGQVQTAAQKYLDSLNAGDILVLSDLTSELTNSGITNLQTPISVKYTKYHRDLITPKTGTIVDYLDPLDKTNVFVLGSISTNSLSV